jgi:hypothetical protein
MKAVVNEIVESLGDRFPGRKCVRQTCSSLVSSYPALQSPEYLMLKVEDCFYNKVRGQKSSGSARKRKASESQPLPDNYDL